MGKMERRQEKKIDRERERERKIGRVCGFAAAQRLPSFRVPSHSSIPYLISFLRQFPSVNSIIYRYTPHSYGSTSAALPRRHHPSLQLSLAFSSSSSSFSSSSSSSFHIYSQMRSKQDPGLLCFNGFLSHVGPIIA